MKLPSMFILLILLYVGSYAALSHMGKYGIAASGKLNTPLFSIGIPDSRQWQPKGLRLVVVKNQDGDWNWTGNTAGYIYAPMILLDRKLWHSTEKIFE
jgi:hypothetical protein